ncbi:MAG: ABC transporter permease [Chloroflexota bacterium]
MLAYLVRRLIGTFFVLLGVALIAFLMVHAIPGSPWERDLSRRATSGFASDDAVTRTLDRRFGLDLPLWRQFTRFLVGDYGPDGFFCGYLCGNLGPSMTQRGRSVNEILFEAPEGHSRWDSRFGYTMRLAGLAMLMVVLVGLPAGVWSAMRRNSAFDLLGSLLMAAGMAVPNFVLGFLLIVLLASQLHLISVRPDWQDWRDWIAPAVILALGPGAMLGRLARTAMLDALQGEYVRTARAKGLAEGQVLTVHVLKNAAIPLLTHLGPVLFELFAASFVIEMMFGFPGFGREYYESVTRLDYPMILALTLLYGLFIALANLLTDLLYAVLDPRVRLA